VYFKYTRGISFAISVAKLRAGKLISVISFCGIVVVCVLPRSNTDESTVTNKQPNHKTTKRFCLKFKYCKLPKTCTAFSPKPPEFCEVRRTFVFFVPFRLRVLTKPFVTHRRICLRHLAGSRGNHQLFDQLSRDAVSLRYFPAAAQV